MVFSSPSGDRVTYDLEAVLGRIEVPTVGCVSLLATGGMIMPSSHAFFREGPMRPFSWKDLVQIRAWSRSAELAAKM